MYIQMKRLASLFALATCLVTASSSHACPPVGRLPDFNCDGKAIIAVIGDSIVYGIGDTAHHNAGGYVLRAQEQLPEATFLNFGVPGLRTKAMLKNLKTAFANPTTSTLAQGLVSADLVIFDVGRNDRWLFGTPLATYRNIKRARSMVETGVVAQSGFSPLIVTAVMLLPNRGSQAPWVKVLNALIEKGSDDVFPGDLHFDGVSKRLLSVDRIHPTSKGYTAAATVFVQYLLKKYPVHAATLRQDADHDGLYDVFEPIRYGTDPTNADTDSDGVKDGEDPSPLNP
jgi:lysophospholipase L1-like esterase